MTVQFRPVNSTRSILFTLSLAASLALSLAPIVPTVRAQAKLKVVTSISILADITKNIAGDKIDLATIVPPDGDAHDHEATPDDIRKIADANVVIVNGLGLEGFIDKLISDSGTKAQIVLASKGLQIRPFAGNDQAAEKAFLGVAGEYDCAAYNHAADDTTDHGACDPHMWQDPTNVIGYAATIAAALSAADAANAATYAANAEAYIAQLKQLDADIATAVAAIPAAKRVLVTNHDALGYYAAQYGFKIVGVVLSSGSAGEIQAPTPQELAAVIDAIKAQGASAIFTENIGNDKVAQQIAAEVGVPVVQSLYTDALGQAGSAGDTYLKMMRANTASIVKALIPQ